MALAPLALFCAVAYALAWLIVLPLWLRPAGLEDGLASLLVPLMMFAPGLAVLLAWAVFREPGRAAAAGLGLGRPGWWRYWAFAWLSFPAFGLAAPFVAAALGLYELDLAGLSGFRELVEQAGQGQVWERTTPHALAGVQLAAVLLAPVLNAPLVLGEELGWRGYLLPRLLPLGQGTALIVSGVIWGVWHAPVVLLGHNYPNAPVAGVLMMVPFCVLFGVLLGWTRLASGSVWPAVIGHGGLNGAAAAVLLFGSAGVELDPFHAGVTGWSGWLLPAAVVGALVLARRLPVLDPA